MKKKIVRAVALILVCSMMVLPVSAAEMTEEAVNAVGGEVIELSEEESLYDFPYVDVDENEWFALEAYVMYETGLMMGKDTEHFAPYEPLARAQFAMIIWRPVGEPDIPYDEIFPDVPDGTWYTRAVLAAYGLNIITGYSDTGYFGPSDYITREQMATMMYRLAITAELDVSARSDFGNFVDGESVSSFAQDAMSWAVARGIITGKDSGTRLDPQGSTSRAETAVILTRFFLSYGE